MLPNLSGLSLRAREADIAAKLTLEEKVLMDQQWPVAHPEEPDWRKISNDHPLHPEMVLFKKQIQQGAKGDVGPAPAAPPVPPQPGTKPLPNTSPLDELQDDLNVEILAIALSQGSGRVECGDLQALIRSAKTMPQLEAAAKRVGEEMGLTLEPVDGGLWVERLKRYCREQAENKTVPGRFFSLVGLKKAVQMWMTNEAQARQTHGDIADWDVSRVSSMNRLFTNPPGLTKAQKVAYAYLAPGQKPPGSPKINGDFNADLSRWDVSNVTTMEGMFRRCDSFDGDLSKWNVSKVTNMEEMFGGCMDFQGRGLDNWKTSSVTNMRGMFFDAKEFDRNLAQWDISNVTNMRYMFAGATNFTGRGLGAWDVSHVKYVEQMFKNCVNFNADLRQWTLSSVVGIKKDTVGKIWDMFEGANMGIGYYAGPMAVNKNPRFLRTISPMIKNLE